MITKPCIECGACCKSFGVYQLNDFDVKRIGENSNLIQKSPECMTMKTNKSHCIALQGTKCSIYDKRPYVCRSFKRGLKECKMAIKRVEFFNL